jgi:hypothetical protein
MLSRARYRPFHGQTSDGLGDLLSQGCPPLHTGGSEGFCKLISDCFGFHVAEGRLRLVLGAAIEGLDDVFFEMCAPRVGMPFGNQQAIRLRD